MSGDEEPIRDFPLFPLGIVALPTELVPLHIFEDRYRTMMGECLERESEFGILWLADDGLRETGCACAITDVLERMDDGRLNLLTRGTRPLRVLSRQEDLPYPAGTVAFLADAEEDADPAAGEDARAAYAELVEHVTDRPPDPDELAVMSAYAMAATVDFGAPPKQSLLDLRSENARLRLLARLLRRARQRMDETGRAEARARSNGKVRFGE